MSDIHVHGQDKALAQALRVEALSQSVRVALSNGGRDADEVTVERAEKYAKFLAETTD